MKPGLSTLNPYAASYIPLAKREAFDKIDTAKVTTDHSRSGGDTVLFGSTESRYHGKAFMNSNAFGSHKIPIPEVSIPKIHLAHGYYGSSYQNPNEMTDEESEMDLEYLRMTFPGISDQSLTDVYVANRGDLEATIDMLSQLEHDIIESSENLPDTLDIGDVSESGLSVDPASWKLKNATSEANASSGPSGAAIVT
ncbi:CUE domain-containing protein [Cephalotus follicularis]|uniref:CUE domain-containing protein n=1 Tax=Cephalotus follicularis TaxID=3775 RepID=A0A1Q3D5G7_CEPFO|nr:CUE domain-containing protein [Cephalotus follicularis]